MSPIAVGQSWHLRILARNVIVRLLNAASGFGERISRVKALRSW
jgi:hypothetical protein